MITYQEVSNQLPTHPLWPRGIQRPNCSRSGQNTRGILTLCHILIGVKKCGHILADFLKVISISKEASDIGKPWVGGDEASRQLCDSTNDGINLQGIKRQDFLFLKKWQVKTEANNWWRKVSYSVSMSSWFSYPTLSHATCLVQVSKCVGSMPWTGTQFYWHDLLTVSIDLWPKLEPS